MRPRFMNRGSELLQLLCEVYINRFNEAPIHESGKSWQGHRLSFRLVVLQ